MDMDLREDPWLSPRQKRELQAFRDAAQYDSLRAWVASGPNDRWHVDGKGEHNLYQEGENEIQRQRSVNEDKREWLDAPSSQAEIDRQARGELWEVWESMLNLDEMRVNVPMDAGGGFFRLISK